MKRFLVDGGTYRIDNLGDIAMLRATCGRLRGAFPGCVLRVITERPDRLARVLPEAEPVAAGPWFRLRVVPVPKALEWRRLVRRVRWKEHAVAGRFPRLARLGKTRDRRATPDERRAADAFFREADAADAVVAAGGGYVNDHYHEHAWKVLATLQLGQGLGKPTAMFGVGLGPVTRPDLIQHGGPVLRRLDLLTLREDVESPAIAARLGVPPAVVRVTGDDAVAAAATREPCARRDGLGVNLRLSASAGVPEAAPAAAADALRRARASSGATFVPLVIRTVDSPENDVDAVRSLLPECDADDASAVLHPDAALDRVQRCRVVVTGAYHNAVFALAMGIPVVALVASDYYAIKLGGVAGMFGVDGACRLIDLRRADLRNALASAVGDAWRDADAFASPLRLAAARQVAAADAAYADFFAKVGRPG